jgi:hypothetical protein
MFVAILVDPTGKIIHSVHSDNSICAVNHLLRDAEDLFDHPHITLIPDGNITPPVDGGHYITVFTSIR